MLLCETKGHVNFEVKWILRTRDWTQSCPAVCSGYRLIFHIYLNEIAAPIPCFFFNVYKRRRCLLLKEMQWEEHNFFWLSVWSPQQWETVKIQTNLYFWTNCLKPGACKKLRITWCKMQFCHPVFTLLISPYTSVPSFMLVLPCSPVQAIETCKLIQKLLKDTKLSFDLMNFKYVRPKLTWSCSQPICGNKFRHQFKCWFGSTFDRLHKTLRSSGFCFHP